MQITTIGLDIAKNVFQVHGIDAAERVVVRKQLRRRQVLEFFKALAPCLVGMEACATAHYWARELMKLGHLVRLMPAKDVKAYVKRNKNDAADAEVQNCQLRRRLGSDRSIHYSVSALSYPSAPCSRGSQLDQARENSQVTARFSAKPWDASPSASAQCCSGLL